MKSVPNEDNKKKNKMIQKIYLTKIRNFVYFIYFFFQNVSFLLILKDGWTGMAFPKWLKRSFGIHAEH